MARGKKAVAMFLVLSVILVVTILAEVALSVMQRQSRLTHHEINRIRAYYAAQAGMNYVLEMLRTGVWTANATGGAIKYTCINGLVDAVPQTYNLVVDPDIPYHVQMAIYPRDANGVSQLDIKTEYTYN